MSRKSHFIRHLKATHSTINEQGFLCIKCEKTFFRKEDLDRHGKCGCSRKVFSFRCDKCELSFYRKYHLLRHYNSIHLKTALNCNSCDAMYNQPKHLLRHIKMVHSKLVFSKTKTNNSSSNNYYICPYCKNNYPNEKETFCKHKRT